MEKETIEEVAERYAESNQYDLEYHDEGGYQGIDTRIFAEKLIDFTNKWQAERMYSEENVRNIAIWAFGFYRRNDLSDSELEDEFNRILEEQFKKK